MRSFSGSSLSIDAAMAVGEATRAWEEDITPDVVFVFTSTAQSADDVAAAVYARFPASIVVGCTSTGEISDGKHLRGAVVLSALVDTGIRWAAACVDAIDVATSADIERAVASMFEQLDLKRDEVDPTELFCLSFIDGLRGREEVVTAQLAEALDGVRLVGGSAGDDLRFTETKVIHGGRAFTNGLVLLCAHAKDRFEIVKHQHFTTTKQRLAITKVDTSKRRVYEIDGLPAMTAYAFALGLAVSEVTSDVTFMNPITFECRGEVYVRSIQQVHDDGSITFFCGVEEGMVLALSGHVDMVERLSEDFDASIARHGSCEFMLGYNCILRALEAEKREHADSLGEIWQRAARSSIGFDTYGEQLDGLHINQTLLAVMLRGSL